MAKKLQLKWHDYRYFPYERNLAKREIKALLSPSSIREESEGLSVQGDLSLRKAKQLTYFSSVSTIRGTYSTKQARLEQALNGNGVRRQSTRYSVHGLHEYKGKFNPQIVRCLLNSFGVDRRTLVMDPFCGSGTTLVECEHLGIRSVGLDLNPMAVYTTNAKLLALSTSVSSLRSIWRHIKKRVKLDKPITHVNRAEESNEYLIRWMSPDILRSFDHLYNSINEIGRELAPIFLVLVSNRIREYSLQDPMDLRIRRRRSPLPIANVFDVVFSDVESMLAKLEMVQRELPGTQARSRAYLGDARTIRQTANQHYGMFVTSPPYASALPYIDTQRLSLIWLSLCKVSELHEFEASLIGSREFRGKLVRAQITNELKSNEFGISEKSAQFCHKLLRSVGCNDGFRRQAVPLLLYRYFVGMKNAFAGLKTIAKHGAHFALVVGTNHTVLDGKKIVIDTPNHLVGLSLQCGWRHVESIPLETYQRYGLHYKNAVRKEYLIILRAQ